MPPLILALDVTGAPLEWLTWQETLTCYAAGRIDRMLGEYEFTYFGGVSRQTGSRSTFTTRSIVVLNGRHPFGWQPQTIRLTNSALFQRDRHVCAYCGVSGPHVKLTRDHIVPLGQGGANTWTNCVTACFSCNNRKGCRTPEQSGQSLLYLPYAPSRTEGLILANRRILADQMDFLAGLVPASSRILPG